jgi:hypothetical protein
MATRCAIWARVSKDEQESGNQLAELRQLAGTRGFAVTAEYVLDGASAWKGEQREQLCQALDSARRGEYDVLLVWALDRLSREGVETTLGLLRRFRESGVMVWSLRSRGRKPAILGWPSCCRACSRGWLPRNPGAAASGSGLGWSGAGGRACPLAGSRVRRTASRAGDRVTWRRGRTGGQHEQEQVGAVPRLPAPGRRQARLPSGRQAPRRASR